MVSRSGRWRGALVGPRAGDQDADAARVLRPAFYELSSELKRAVPPSGEGWRHADHLSPYRLGIDHRGAPQRCAEGLEAYVGAGQENCRAEVAIAGSEIAGRCI